MKDNVFDTTVHYPAEVTYSRKSKKMINPRQLPKEERPRERLFKNGPSSMSDEDLLAIILNSGIPGKNVSEVARDLLAYLDDADFIPSIKEVSRLKGIGKSKR